MACNGFATMTAMKRLRPGLKRAGRWLGPAALLAAVPKCALCLLAYAGLGTALGLGGPELCGAAAGTNWPALLLGLGALGAGGAVFFKAFSQNRPPAPASYMQPCPRPRPTLPPRLPGRRMPGPAACFMPRTWPTSAR